MYGNKHNGQFLEHFSHVSITYLVDTSKGKVEIVTLTSRPEFSNRTPNICQFILKPIVCLTC